MNLKIRWVQLVLLMFEPETVKYTMETEHLKLMK